MTQHTQPKRKRLRNLNALSVLWRKYKTTNEEIFISLSRPRTSFLNIKKT